MGSPRSSRARRGRRRPRRWLTLLAGGVLVAGLLGWVVPRWQNLLTHLRAWQPLLLAETGAPAAKTDPPPDSVPGSRLSPAPLSPPARPETPALPAAEPAPPSIATQSVATVFEAQLALARQGISPGAIDGQMGSRTRNALRAFQSREGLPPTGELDLDTRQRLRLDTPPFRDETVSAADLDRLLPLGSTWLAKSEQPRLDYETVLELVAERSCSHPDFIRQLNPALDWQRVVAGAVVRVPNVSRPQATRKAASVRIQLAGCTLQAFDEQQRLLAHFPCSIGRTAERRPAGELRVAVLVPHPNYTFDPQRFPNSPEARTLDRKLILPPGPNNPVGTVWIGLSLPAYGIHGTPHPEKAGQAESLGCFRLANWNAEHLLELSWVGMPVYVEP